MSKRKKLSDYLRDGARDACRDGECRGTYYDHVTSKQHEAGPLWFLDPIMLIFVGKFGPAILASLGAEHRVETWTEARVWDREQVCERLTKAVNGGVWELHQRLHEVPRLWTTLEKLGYKLPAEALPVARKHPAAFTSVFRAITWLSDVQHKTPAEIATILEECRL